MSRKLLSGIGVALFGVCVSLVLVEIVIRLFLIGASAAPTWNDRPLFYFGDEGATTLQDYNYAKEKPKDVYRIAVVGDSYSFAPYMQFTDTFPKKLEQMLNLGATSKKVEVINYGVPAYSTSHQVVVVERAINEGADLIFLQMTLNDAELKPYRPKEVDLSRPDKFGGLILSGWKATLAKYWKTYEFVATRLHNTKTHRKYRNYFIGLFENPRSWKTFVKSFRRIAEKCSAAKKPLVAAVFPLFGVPLDERYPFKVIHDKVGAFLTEEKVPYLDLYQNFAGIPLERIQVIPGMDRHPNEIAHRIAAEAIYLWMESQNLFPDEFKIKAKYNERLGITGKGLEGDDPNLS